MLAQNGNVEVMAASSMCSIVSHFSDKIFGNIVFWYFCVHLKLFFYPAKLIELALLRMKRSTDMGAVLFQSSLNSAIP